MVKIKRFLKVLVAAGCIGFILAGVFRPDPVESAAVTVSLGTTSIGEGDDYSTRVLGLPWWNMNGSPYPDIFTALKNIDKNSFSVTPGGFWKMRSVNTDPIIWLSWTGIDQTQRVLKMGDSYPIDASKYQLLSYYMCLDNAPAPTDYGWAANVYWFYDRIPFTDPANGISNYLLFVQQGRFKNDGDCELITFDLSQPSSWGAGSWNNTPRKPMGFRVDPINVSNASYQVGWVRLTTKDTGNVVPIAWSGAPSGENKFYASLSGCGQKGILLGTKSGSSGTFNWGQQVISGFSIAHPLPLPESFEPGSYHLYMVDSAGTVSCAGNNPLKIHTAPTLAFQKPSFQSGPDFATGVLGDPWGMANSEDIESLVNVSSAIFNGGLLTVTSDDNDPQLYMNLNGGTIPTSQFRYASFRFVINGTHTPTSDWVQRWIWWYSGGPGVDNVTTQDMEVYEGLHVYTLDLKTAPTENCSSNCWSGAPQVLRFDPFETPKPTNIVMDYVLLTGPESINQGEIFPIFYTTTAGTGAAITFFYDTDTDPSNGRTLIGTTMKGGTTALHPLLMGAFNLFVPYTRRADMSEIPLYEASDRFEWDTTGVPEGAYYISADVSDGINLTTWYSELPVTIQ